LCSGQKTRLSAWGARGVAAAADRRGSTSVILCDGYGVLVAKMFARSGRNNTSILEAAIDWAKVGLMLAPMLVVLR